MRIAMSLLTVVVSVGSIGAAALLPNGPGPTALGFGPGAMRTLLSRYDQHPSAELAAEIDAAAGQRDAVSSRLFWHTDLAEAKAAARAEHKPILYLRMLGRLTDEYSCANSRFFRTVLYANASVSRLLRERFVLVWESERPVPVLTIDYGDGRTVKRTITGNSAHYVLDPDGQVVDVLPGLFDPVRFAAIVDEAGKAAMRGERACRDYLDHAAATLAEEWSREAGGPEAEFNPADGSEQPVLANGTEPDARAASEIATGKTRIEAPLLRAMSPKPAGAWRVEPPNAALAAGRAVGKSSGEMPLIRAIMPDIEVALDAGEADNGAWERLAAIHAADARLDENSLALMRRQDPAHAAGPVFRRTVSNFEHALALDTARNNHLLRGEALGWLRESRSPIALADLNRRVYATLFLTPRSDPWLGLVPATVYTALTNNGCPAGSAQ